MNPDTKATKRYIQWRHRLISVDPDDRVVPADEAETVHVRGRQLPALLESGHATA